MQRGFVFCLALASCLVANSISLRPQFKSRYPDPSIPELSDDGYNLMEPAIVPEPEDGGRWWYTPSRRSHQHSHRSKSRLMREMMSNKVNEDIRLPGDITPSAYTIKLLPFIEEGNFTTDGEIEILINCVRDTNNITLNAADITIKQLSVAVRF